MFYVFHLLQVWGKVCGAVWGEVCGAVWGKVCGAVWGEVCGKVEFSWLLPLFEDDV